MVIVYEVSYPSTLVVNIEVILCNLKAIAYP